MKNTLYYETFEKQRIIHPTRLEKHEIHFGSSDAFIVQLLVGLKTLGQEVEWGDRLVNLGGLQISIICLLTYPRKAER